jgi:hypothetical protein
MDALVMAFYSVWDWNRNSYRIYSTPRAASVGDDPVPPRPTGISSIGADPDTGVKPLPSGAKFEGYSHLPRGEIRRLAGGLGEAGDDAGAATSSGGRGWLMFAGGLAVGAGAIWLWRGRR